MSQHGMSRAGNKGTKHTFNSDYMVRRRNSPAAEEVARFLASFPLFELVDIRKDIRPPKTRSNSPIDRQLSDCV